MTDQGAGRQGTAVCRGNVRFAVGLLCACLLGAVAVADGPAGFETPPAESPGEVLPPGLAAGPDFHVVSPVQSDGLMYPFGIDSRFGHFSAYGRAALELRIHEIAALTELDRTSPVAVVAGGVTRGIGSQVETAVTVVTHPVSTITGIPKGIAHLFHGYVDEGKETAAAVDSTVTGTPDGTGGGKGGATAAEAAAKGETAAKGYATRYLGLTAAERHWYEKLGVDPYTDNETLRRAIHSTAKLDAAAGFGMRFVGIPSIPGIGDVHEVVQAVYQEDPATIRARTRAMLASYGLSPAEVDRWQRSPVLSPTRQLLLLQLAAQLDAVAGRGELFRHAIGLTSDGEARVYLRSVGLLVLAHRDQALTAILPGVRLPAARRADGSLVVCGAFDAVYWTRDVAAAEEQIRAALMQPEAGAPAAGAEGPAAPARALWLGGSASPRVRGELLARGWQLHEAPAADPAAAHAAPDTH